MRRLRTETQGLAPEQRRERMRALRDELTEGERKAVREMRRMRREQRRRKRGE